MNIATALSSKAGLAANKPPASHLPAVPDKEKARLQCYALLAISDIAAISIAFLAANSLYLGNIQSTHGITMLTILLPIYLGVATLNRAYSGNVLEQVWGGTIRTLQAFAFAAASVLLIVYLLKVGSEFSRLVFIMGMCGSASLLLLFRVILRHPIVHMLGGTPYTTVVIRDGVHYNGHASDIIFNAAQIDFDPQTQDPIRFHALAGTLANADRVIIACPQERYVAWSSVLKGMALAGEILTDEEDHLGLIGVGRHGDRRTMVVAAGPLHLRDRAIKRVFDILFSTFALLILSPLLLATAIAIRMESKGPIFFNQNRIGRDNRLFRMYKFRSMYAELCDANASRLTGRNDDRVTRVGQFIRRTSIDELPQLLNVLRGDMSIVGPRPHALAAKAADLLYWDVDPRYRHRHSVKPGLTGLAQVRGYRGNTEKTEDLTNRLIADLEYVDKWSIWADIRIIFQTLGVASHNNAF